MNTFDYIQYDSLAAGRQERVKAQCIELAHFIATLGQGRPQSLALTKLEECYMWIGKAIRDDQIKRVGECEHQEKRGNS